MQNPLNATDANGNQLDKLGEHFNFRMKSLPCLKWKSSQIQTLPRNRVGLSQMVKETDHALCVYHQEGSDQWRLSLISKSYSWNQGIQITDLDARRYTFLLGQGAKIQTPTKQFLEFQDSETKA